MMNKPNEQTQMNIVLGVTTLVLLAIASYVLYMRPQWKTEDQANGLAIVCQYADNPNELVVNTRDAWKREFSLESETNEYAIAYTVTSAGRDGIRGNKDDIVVTEIDWNKSRMVGHWIGKKSKEVVVGIADGIKEESKFDKTEEKVEKVPLWSKVKAKFTKE